MAIKNYSTVIPIDRTISEIQKMLGQHGARRIGMEYENKHVAAIAFEMQIGAQSASYRLPCRYEGIMRLLKEEMIDGSATMATMQRKKLKVTEAHCRAVGWRIVRDWLDAQLALIEAEMAEMQEVMLPYMVTADGRTVYQVLDGGRRLLEKK